MTPVILFRPSYQHEEEMAIAKKYFPLYTYRSEIPKNSLVIPRYSALPEYHALEKDCQNLGSKLINSYAEFTWIKDFGYYEDLKDYTPKTWFEWEIPYIDYQGPFVLKGRTNSRKQQWRTRMYAETRRDAIEIASELANDSLIGPQGIIYREYVPLKVIEMDTIYGLPFANEWRFFYHGTKRLAYGYYWSNANDFSQASIDQVGLDFADKVASIAAEHTTFFVVDIAEKASGGWTMIELNTGEMAGPSEIDLDLLYGNLLATLTAGAI